MIEINHAQYAYDSCVRVFDDLNLKLEDGHVYGLLGLNGAGKTTLLNLLSGLFFVQEGSIEIDGNDVSQRKVETLEQIYYVADEFELPAFELATWVKIYSPFYPSFNQEILENCLKEFNLSEINDLNSLSLGEKKKAMISFALACQTRLVIMDEPTNGLDIPSKAQFRRIIAKYLGEEQTLIISTHQVHDVSQLLDEYLILHDNGQVWKASSSEVEEKYYFAKSSSAEDSLYSEPCPEGYNAIYNNEEGRDSKTDLELLFNAVTKGAIR